MPLFKSVRSVVLLGAFLLAHAIGHGGNGPLEVVADANDIVRELGDGVLGAVGLLALGPLAQIVHLGVRAQETVGQIGLLAFELPDPCLQNSGCYGGTFRRLAALNSCLQARWIAAWTGS